MKKKYSRANVFDEDGNLLPIEQRTFMTNEGYECVIIDGGSKLYYVTCSIDNNIFEARAGNVRNGEVAYLCHKSMCGIGYTGYGIYTPRNSRQAYTQWRNMFNRCYSESQLAKFPTYRDVTVHEDWHNFQNFAEWFYKKSNYKPGWQLDKDLLSKKIKIYSEETCVFLPKHLNTFIIDAPLGKGDLPRGVRLRSDTGKYTVQFSCKLINNGKSIIGGCFNTKEEAISKLKCIKNTYIPVVKNYYTNKLPKYVLDKVH